MKRNEINKDDLLKTAWDIVFQEGLDKLSIRYLAKQADVAIGSVYNYFPSKDELVLEIVETYWKEVFYEAVCMVTFESSYADFVNDIYLRISAHNDEFQHYFLSHLRILNHKTVELLKAQHLQYLDHFKEGLMLTLNKDDKINEDVWTDIFTKEKLVDFTLDLIMNGLSKGSQSFLFETQLLKKLLGEETK